MVVQKKKASRNRSQQVERWKDNRMAEDLVGNAAGGLTAVVGVVEGKD